MSDCCGADGATAAGGRPGSLEWFGKMVENCLEYARAEQAQGSPIVGIMCEFTPRELIMAAGAVPVLLCGGSGETVSAAEKVLPANLCPLIKSTYGYSLEHKNPFLEMAELIVAETTCDGKKKMYELLSEDRDMHVLELPQKVDDEDALLHWVRELRKLKDALETRFGRTISDEDMRVAIRRMNEERRLRRELAALMKADAPPLTGSELLGMNSLISGMPANLEQYERALKELPRRARNRVGEPRVRVLLTGVPLPHGAERVLEIIEANGGLVVCLENCSGLKPILEDVDPDAADPVQAMAEKYFHLPCSVMTHNNARIDSLRSLAREYRADCVIDLIWQACITYDVESHLVRRLVEEELDLPYLRIETDYSQSDSAGLTMRLQALFETARDRADFSARE